MLADFEFHFGGADSSPKPAAGARGAESARSERLVFAKVAASVPVTCSASQK